MTAPPDAALEAVLSPSTRVTRRVDIYEEDGTTPFFLDAPLLGGSVSVDGTRDERRSFDLNLANYDGSLDQHPNGLWYDKVFKIFRGIAWEGTTESRLKFGRGSVSGPEYVYFNGDQVFFNGDPVTFGFATGAQDAYLRTATSPAHALVSGTTLVLQCGIEMERWTPDNEMCIISVWDTSGNQRSFKFSVRTTGALRVGISTNGTNELFLDSSPTGFVDGSYHQLKIEVDMNNGAGGKTARFYHSTDTALNPSWIQIGSEATSTSLGTTTYYAASEDLRVGATGNGDMILATFSYIYLLDSLRKIVDLDFTELPSTTHALIDGNGVAYQIVGTSWSILGGETETKTWETQLGEFLADHIEDQDFPHSISISGRDFTKKLLEAEFGNTTTFPIGSDMETVIKTIAINGGITKFVMPMSGKVLGKDFVFEGTVNRWKAITDIATAYGYELFFDAYGYLVLREFRDPITTPSVFTFETGEKGSLAKYKKSTNDTMIYNEVVVRQETSGAIPLVVKVQNTSPDSPTSIDNLGRTKTYNYSSSFFTDVTQMLETANNLLSIHALEAYDVTMDSLVIFWLEATDIVEFIDPDPNPGDPTKFLLSSFTVPLNLGLMQTVAKRVSIVG